MSEIFVIAEEEIVLAFRLIGVAGRAVEGRDEALKAFRDATSPRERNLRPTVLILACEVAQLLEPELRDWELGSSYPLVVPIPSQKPGAAGYPSVADVVRQAIGIAV